MSIKKLGSTKLTDDVLVSSVNLASSEVAGILGVANGGTGQSVFTNGQLLIGNTTGNTLTKATLTAGSGISITNGAGSISIAATAVSSQWVTTGSDIYYNTGNVGIGTATPSASSRLHVQATDNFGIHLSNAGTGGVAWQLGATNDAFNSGGGRFIITNSNSSGLSAFTIVQSTGNIGIGTNSPSQKLSVNGTATATAVVINGTTAIGTSSLSIYAGGAGGVAWSSGLSIGSATSYCNFIQDVGISRWRNFGTGGFQWFSSGGFARMNLNDAGDFEITARASIATSAWGTTAAKFLVGAYLNDGSSAIAQFNGFLRIRNQLFIHDDADIVNQATVLYDSTGLRLISSAAGAGSRPVRLEGAAVFLPTYTWLRTADVNLIRDSYFGYSSSYRVAQVGVNAASSRGLALGVDLTGNASGNFQGKEIVIPNDTAIIAPNAANNNYVGVLRVDSSNNICIGGADYTTAGRIYVNNSTGNVGIGTTSPGARLHVSAVSTNNVLRLERTGTSAGGGFIYANVNEMFGVTDGTLYPFLVKQGAPTESLVVASSGNVGIGTTSPAYRLQVSGSLGAVRLEGPYSSGNPLKIQSVYSGTTECKAEIWFENPLNNVGGGLTFAVQPETGGAAASAIMTVRSGGVGIGTTSPGYALDVVATGTSAIPMRIRGASSSTNNTQLRFYGANAGADLWAIGNALPTNDASRNFDIYDLVAGANRIRIDSSGNFGIGTTSPYGRLSVTGAHSSGRGIVDIRSSDSAFLCVDTATTDGGLRLQVSGTDKWLVGIRGSDNLYFNGTGDTTRVAFMQSGAVGIGTTSFGTSATKLAVGPVINSGTAAIAQFDGFIRLRDTILIHSSNTDAADITYDTTGLKLTTSATGTAGRIIALMGGNVGVGTTSPNGTLDVGKSVTTPSIKLGNVNYGNSYESVWGVQSGAQSIMIFGNNGDNQIRAGNTLAGGFLDIITNNTAAFTSAHNGNLAVRFNSAGNTGFGTTTITQRVTVNGNVLASDFILSSDIRRKKELVRISDALATVLAWVGYTYCPIDEEKRRAGLMAQDVEVNAPHAVYTDDEGWKSLSYEQTIPYLVEAIRDLHRMVEALA